MDALVNELQRLGPRPPIPTSRPPEVAETVTWLIFNRWQASKVKRVFVGGAGAPEPIAGKVLHGSAVVQGRTSPSGKTLFLCPSCRVEGIGPLSGACPGMSLLASLPRVQDFLVSGGSYEPDATGTLRPVAPRPG